MENNPVMYQKNGDKILEKQRRWNGPKLIKQIHLTGTNDKNDIFSNNPYTSKIDIGKYQYLSIQVSMYHRIGYDGTIKVNYTIYDEAENCIFDDTSDLRVEADYNKFGMVWILRGSDGSRVDNGRYHLEVWVNNSSVYEYDFLIYDSTQQNQSAPAPQRVSRPVKAPDVLPKQNTSAENKPTDELRLLLDDLAGQIDDLLK